MLAVARRRAAELRARRTRTRVGGAAIAVVLVVVTSVVVLTARDRDSGEAVYATDPPEVTPGVEGDPRPAGWSPMAPAPLSGRAGAVTVWTGEEMIVWGGDGAFSDGCMVLDDGTTRCGEQAKADGARYDPAADSWRMLPPAPVAPDQGDQLTYVGAWTGDELVIWGGPEGEGAAYDPGADSWRTIAGSPLAPRRGAHAVWTGRELIVRGGSNGRPFGPQGPGELGELGDGAAYDPSTDSWRSIADGSGGAHGAEVFCDGWLVVLDDVDDDVTPGSTAARYDPDTDSWTDLPASPVEYVGTATCAGTQVVAVGAGPNRQGAAAARLDVRAGVWVPVDPPSTAGAVEPVLVTAVPSSPSQGGGSLSVVLVASTMVTDDGGDLDVAALDTGLGTWQLLPSSGLSGRSAPSVVWADDELLVWGGAAQTGFTSEPAADGARYRPGSGGVTSSDSPDPTGLPSATDPSPGTDPTVGTDSSPANEPAPPRGVPEAGDPATWIVDVARPPSPTSSSFTALVSRLGCNGGVTGTVLRPGVVITETEVVVTFTVEADPDGGFCPSNEQVPYVVDLGQPLGARALVDGVCLDGEASTTTFCREGSRRFP